MDSKKLKSSSSSKALTKNLIASSGSKISLVGKHHVLPLPGPTPGSTTDVAEKNPSQISVVSIVQSLNSFVIHAREDWEDDGRNGQYAYGTYRTEMRFALVETLATLLRFFTWPPRGKYFFSSGYYPDIAEGGDVGPGGIVVPPVKEIWIMNLDSDVTAALQKMFVGSTKITLKKGYNGLPMAVVTYGGKIERDKGYNASVLRKWGPGKLDWVHPHELRIENLPENITQKDLQNMYPNSKGISIQKQGHAVMKYQSAQDADAAYKKAMMNRNSVDLGDRGIGWKKPNENYVVKVPGNTSVEDIFKRVPRTQNVHFLTASDGDRVAITVHADAAMQGKSFQESVLPKLGSQILRWQRDKPVLPPPKAQPKSNASTPTATSSSSSKPTPGPGRPTSNNQTQNQNGGKDGGKSSVIQGKKKSAVAPSNPSEDDDNDSDDDAKSDKSINVEDDVNGAAKMSPEELAHKLWKPPTIAYSNLSNLFKPTLYIKKCPKSMTISQLLKMFHGASKIDIKRGIGILEFDDPVKAAKAFHAAHKIIYEGAKLKITTYKPAILNAKKKKRKKWKKNVGKFFSMFKKKDGKKEKKKDAEKQKPAPPNNNSKKEIQKKVEMKKKKK